jgi:hypothetical protein
VIQDLDGATSEPSRRTHVAVLSAAVAAASLVVLLMLVAPPTPSVAPPQVASPLASPAMMTVVSNAPRGLPVDVMRSSVCSASTLLPAGRVPIDFGAAGEQSFLVIYDRNGSVPIAVMQEEKGTGRLILTCAADSVMPRLNRAR